MAGLIETFGLGTVVIILIVGIAAIVGFIEWCKKLWSKRKAFAQENQQLGMQQEHDLEEREARLEKGEARMDALEANVQKLTEIAENQQRMIELLVQSDELDIKSWIKAQHEKWIPLGCIDSQTLDLLEQRYAIYTKEGGNSWAKKLVEEMRALPTATVVPVPELYREHHEDQQ